MPKWDPAQPGVLDAQCLGHSTSVKDVKGSFPTLNSENLFRCSFTPFRATIITSFHLSYKLLLITLLCRHCRYVGPQNYNKLNIIAFNYASHFVQEKKNY